MNCEEAKQKFQMLIDDELDEDEISPIIDHIKSCNKCSNEYISLLKLRKKLNVIKGGAQEEEWFEVLRHSKGRRLFNKTGIFLLISSWLLLFSFAVFVFFKDSSENTFVKFTVAISIFSVIILFIITVKDRYIESKTDKYKDVIK